MDFIPDGSGTVTIRICDSNGNVVKTSYSNLSDIADMEEQNGNTDK